MQSCSIHQVRITIRSLPEFLSKIEEMSQARDTHIILFNAMHMAGIDHAKAALFHAFRAQVQGSMISNRVEMEALLFASGSRQILHGMRFGIHEGENAAYLCVCPENTEILHELMELCSPAFNEDWDTLSDERLVHLCNLFSITPHELEIVGRDRVRDLVLERVALLEVYR